MKTVKTNLVRYGVLSAILLLALSTFATIAWQQTTKRETAVPANVAATPASTPESDGINRPTSEPYTGELSIFEGEKREENLQLPRVLDILKIKDNATVADIGAGSGWLTTRAAKRTKGTVYAVEINQEYINHINERAKKENLANIKTVLGKEDDPLLPANQIEAVLILKTYHEIAQPVRFMKNLRKSLMKNGLVGIIDRNGAGDDHGIERDQVVKEAAQAGFVLHEEHDFVKPDGMDYFLVFRFK